MNQEGIKTELLKKSKKFNSQNRFPWFLILMSA